MRRIISNSSPLIAFLKKKEINLLRDLFGTIMIPIAVHQELLAGEISVNSHLERELLESSIKDGWIKIETVPKYLLPNIPLGKGEIEAINLSLLDPSSILLIDEKKGRKIAQAYRIPVLGTLGILKLAFQKKLRSRNEISININNLLNSGFYLSSKVILAFFEDGNAGKFTNI